MFWINTFPTNVVFFLPQDANDQIRCIYALIGSGSARKAANLFLQLLNDYIYNGGDVSKTFD